MVKKNLLEQAASALYYVAENGDPKIFYLERYRKLADCLMEVSKVLLEKDQPKIKVSSKIEVVEKIPAEQRELLDIEEDEDFIIVRPRQFLRAENFRIIASVIQEFGGKYIPAGRGSYFRIKKA